MMYKLKYLKNDFGDKTIGFKSHYSLNEFVNKRNSVFKFNHEENQDNKNKLPIGIDASIKTFYNNLIDFLNSHGFYPHLIETSLYKPESSSNSAQFYVTVFCPDKNNLDKYVEGIKMNIDDRQSKNGFGPIIHNENLSLSPYYFKQTDPFICKPLERDNLKYYSYGQYTYKDKKGREFVPFETLTSQVDSFFNLTTADFQSEKKTKLESSISLNSSLLIPLPKPSDRKSVV